MLLCRLHHEQQARSFLAPTVWHLLFSCHSYVWFVCLADVQKHGVGTETAGIARVGWSSEKARGVHSQGRDPAASPTPGDAADRPKVQNTLRNCCAPRPNPRRSCQVCSGFHHLAVVDVVAFVQRARCIAVRFVIGMPRLAFPWEYTAVLVSCLYCNRFLDLASS